MTYQDPSTGEPKSLRKFYRFGVQNPLVTTFKQARWRDESLVEAQLRNVSKLPLYIDSIKFLPATPFIAEDTTSSSRDAAGGAIASDDDVTDSVRRLLTQATQTLVNPQEELQRVFRITYDPAADPASIGAQVLDILTTDRRLRRFLTDIAGVGLAEPGSFACRVEDGHG